MVVNNTVKKIMALIEDTKKLTEQLFRNGSTNNEQLQLLLWNLKEISELNNEEISMPEGDFPIFFMKFLTELANSYRPTNSSKLPQRLLSIDSSLNDMCITIQEATEEFNRKVSYIVDNKESFELTSECVSNVRNKAMEASLTVRNKIDEWLVEIRY
jgi:hypothetical protein